MCTLLRKMTCPVYIEDGSSVSVQLDLQLSGATLATIICDAINKERKWSSLLSLHRKPKHIRIWQWCEAQTTFPVMQHNNYNLYKQNINDDHKHDCDMEKWWENPTWGKNSRLLWSIRPDDEANVDVVYDWVNEKQLRIVDCLTFGIEKTLVQYHGQCFLAPIKGCNTIGEVIQVLRCMLYLPCNTSIEEYIALDDRDDEDIKDKSCIVWYGIK